MDMLHAIQRITQGYGALQHWQHWDKVREALRRPPPRLPLQCGKIGTKRRKVE